MELKQRLALLIVLFTHQANKRIQPRLMSIGEVVSQFSVAHFKENVAELIHCSAFELEMAAEAKTEEDLLAIFPGYGLSKVEVEGDYVLVGEPTIAEETSLRALNDQLIDFTIGRHTFPTKDEKPFIRELVKAGFKNSAELSAILFSFINTDDEQVFISGIDIIDEVADYLSPTETHKFRALLSTDQLVRELVNEQATAPVQRSVEIPAAPKPVKKPAAKEKTIEAKLELDLELPSLDVTGELELATKTAELELTLD